jgi:hypothetical protein
MSTLSAPQYLSELTRLEGLHPLDWPSPSPNVYEQEVGQLTLRLEMAGTNLTRWRILHPRGGVLNSGSSESYTIAALEMLKYAEHWVRTAMVGVMA